MRKLITPELNELDQQSLVYISEVSERVGPLPAPPPNGAGEIQRTLRRINEEVGFARLTPSNAGKQFIDEAKSILERG
jgi:multiple sugar transport system substrate-binding protein